MSKRAKRSIYVAGTFALLLALSVMAGCWASATTDVKQLLSEARLSPLPATATNVEYYQWNGLFTGETYVKFELSAEDMRKFISNSPALSDIKPKIYDTNHQHIPYPVSTSDTSLEHDYFDQHPKFPSWFDMTVRGNGRKYVLPWGPNMWVLLDEDRHIVWLRLIKG
jgi:hypothetical protein